MEGDGKEEGEEDEEEEGKVRKGQEWIRGGRGRKNGRGGVIEEEGIDSKRP